MLDKIERYTEIFIPGKPVMNERFLVGRRQEQEDIEKMLKRPGRHAIVIGDRGVGKTSLVKQMLNKRKRPVVWRGCSPQLKYNTVFRDLLEDLRIDLRTIETVMGSETTGKVSANPFRLGAEGEYRRRSESRSRTVGSDVLTPWATFRLLREHAPNAVLVIDEYDAISYRGQSSEFHEGIAFTIKHLSDHSDSCDAKIIVVGIAYSSEALLGKHESIERNAREIYLKPLRQQDFRDFLEGAESALGLQFDDDVKARLAREALGYPYFVHLVGLEAVDAMLARDRQARIVTRQDYDKGLQSAVDAAFRSELRKYRSALERMEANDKNVTRELVNWKPHSILRPHLRRMLAEKYGLSSVAFDSSLARLEKDIHLIYVARHLDEVRFVDPLLKPFLRSKLKSLQKKEDVTQSELFPGGNY